MPTIILLSAKRNTQRRSTELKKLARIRRVYAAIRKRRDLIQEILALGDVVELSKDASRQLAQAEQQDAAARAQVDILKPQLEQSRQALEATSVDDLLVRHAVDITRLNEQRIKVRSARDDLPRRKHEYHLELNSLAELATEIGWDFEEPSELVEKVPSRTKVEAVRVLLARHGELAAELRNKRTVLEGARAAQQDKAVRLKEIGDAVDVSRLAAVLIAVRRIGDVADRIHAAHGRAVDVSTRIEKRLLSMKPTLPEGTDIEALVVPPTDVVTAHRDDVRDWTLRHSETKQKLTKARNDLERDQVVLEQRVQDEGIVEPGEVEKARSYRDLLWGLIKARYITGSEIPAEAAKAHTKALRDLPASLEGAVERADGLADRRFDQAEAAGELAVLARNIAGHETQIRQLEAGEAAQKTEGKRLDEAWRALWTDVPIKALAPDVMLAWLKARDEIVTLVEGEREAQRQLAESRRQEQEAVEQVHTALANVGWSARRDRGRFATRDRRTRGRVSERAADEGRENRRNARGRAHRQVGGGTATGDLDEVKAEWNNWGGEWAKAVAAINLVRDDTPAVVSEQVNVIDDMREHAAAARNLRDERIAAIERDIEIFEQTTAEITSGLAPDLAGSDADTAVVKLDRQREEAMKLHEQHRKLTETMTEQQRKIKELEDARKAAWIPVRPLLEAVDVKDVEKLRAAIERSDRLRSLSEELDDVMESLHEQGDGLAIEALEKECQGVDIDEVQASEEEAEAELKMLEEQREEASAARREAQNKFEAIGGDDAAAQAAAHREEALAAMRNAAQERYVRVRASAMLLRWAVDRYRTEKQGPLLRRASELFRLLTRDSFERLEVRFDERESMHLTGVRPDGEVVPVPGLSTGTEDQLFLALRIAAIDDYLMQAEALPFVADDLFINFDSSRSAAGFEVLGQLAERTQVLFYTHHPHLVDVARETLGKEVNVVTLGNATPSSRSRS